MSFYGEIVRDTMLLLFQNDDADGDDVGEVDDSTHDTHCGKCVLNHLHESVSFATTDSRRVT